MQFDKNSAENLKNPHTSCNIKLSDINFNLSSNQINTILFQLGSISQFGNQSKLPQYRPRGKYGESAPSQWLKYLFLTQTPTLAVN